MRLLLVVIVALVVILVAWTVADNIVHPRGVPPPSPTPTKGDISVCVENRGFIAFRFRMWVDDAIVRDVLLDPDDLECGVEFVAPGVHRVLARCVWSTTSTTLLDETVTVGVGESYERNYYCSR